MALSNTATPKYYGRFREAVLRGEIPVCREISMEMNRIDDLIANPGVWYDDKAMDGFVKFCERELTLTDGTDLKLLAKYLRSHLKNRHRLQYWQKHLEKPKMEP